MRVFVSADIEGVNGIVAPEEANPDHPQYPPFRDQMAREVAAVCQGCQAAGAVEIVVKDAHWHGRNLRPEDMPDNVKLIRGWSGHPLKMMDGLTEKFDVVMLVGYHSAAGSAGHPLAHSFSGRVVQELRLNGQRASEMIVNAHAAWNLGVPVGLVSGDAQICDEAAGAIDGIVTVATTQGKGAAAMAYPRSAVLQALKSGAQTACTRVEELSRPALSDTHVLEIKYKKAESAYRAAFYPGVTQLDDVTVKFEHSNYQEILRALLFVI